MTRPAEILALHWDGSLRIHSAADDQTEYTERKEELQKIKEGLKPPETEQYPEEGEPWDEGFGGDPSMDGYDF